MNVYTGFSKDASSLFSSCFHQYVHKLISETTTQVLFDLSQCSIVIALEKDQVGVYILEKGTSFTDNKFYNARNLFEFRNIYFKNSEEQCFADRIRSDLRAILILVLEHCHDILDGDFSWHSEFYSFIKNRALGRWGNKYKPNDSVS